MATWVSTQSGTWSVASGTASSPWYDNGAQTALNTIPGDGDTVTIIGGAAGHSVEFNVDQTTWTTGMILTINGGAVPGMLYCNYSAAGTYYMKIKTGTTLKGTTVTNNGRLLANSDGTWAGTTALPNDRTFIIDLLGTAYVDLANLDCNLRHTVPTNKFVTTYGSGTLDTVVSIASNVITTTANAPANTTQLRLTCSGAFPSGLNATDLYYVVNSTTTGKTMQLALQSGGTPVTIGALGAVTLKFFQGYASGSATVSCLEDVSADAPWSTTNGLDYCVLADIGPANYDQQRVGLVTITGGATPSLELSAAVDSAQYPRARVYLMARNIQLRSAGTSSSQAIVSGGTNCHIGGCLINTAGTGTTFYGYGTNVGTTNTISGTVSGCGSGVYYGSGHTISGTVSGCGNGFYNGSGFTISGTVSGCTYGVRLGSGHTISGATFTGSTYDLYIVPKTELFNTIMGGTTENYGYNTNNVPSWSYVESYDHGGSANTFKSWTRGGITVSDTTPASLPTGYAVVYKHTCEDVTMQNFRQIKAVVLPGATLKVDGQIRIADDHTAWAPRLEILAASADPLWGLGGAVLATSSVAQPDGTITGTFQTVSCTYTNTGTRNKKVLVRMSAKRASGDMYENWTLDYNYPAVTDVRKNVTWGYLGTTLTGSAYIPAAADVEFGVNVDATTGTFVVPAVSDVKALVTYGAGGTEYTGTYSGGGNSGGIKAPWSF